LAAASEDGTVTLWNTSTLARAVTLRGHAGPAMAAAFHPDGTAVFSIGADGIKSWDIRRRNPSPRFLGRHNDLGVAIAVSPDGRKVASSDLGGVTTVREATTGQVLRSWVAASGVADLRFSSDGETLISATEGGLVQIRRVDDGRLLASFSHGGTLMAVDLSSDGTIAVSAGTDQIIKLWSTQHSKLIAELKGHKGMIFDLQFQPGTHRIVSASGDKTIAIWNWNLQVPELLRSACTQLQGYLKTNPEVGGNDLRLCKN
jgi:WD40 repeat protein